MFPSDKAIFKILYLALRNISKRWTMPIADLCRTGLDKASQHSKHDYLRILSFDLFEISNFINNPIICILESFQANKIIRFLYQNAIFIPEEYLVYPRFRCGYDVQLDRLTAICAVYRKVRLD